MRVFLAAVVVAATCLSVISAFSVMRAQRTISRIPTVMAHAADVNTAESMKEMVDRALLGMGKKKKLSLLGSTGSIGTQTLDICRERPEQFECVAMAAGSNLDLLANQSLFLLVMVVKWMFFVPNFVDWV